jgi:hypothetical protein
MAKATRRREAEREMESGRAEDLPRLAEQVAARCGVAVRSLSSPGRPPAVSTARRELIRAEVRCANGGFEPRTWRASCV